MPVLLPPDGIPSLVILPLKPKFVPIPKGFPKYWLNLKPRRYLYK